MAEDGDCVSLRNNKENCNENASIQLDPTPTDVSRRGDKRVTFINPLGQTTRKRQAANSPSTLKSSTTSLPNRDAFQRQCLVSAQKSLTNTFEYASIPSHFAAPALYQPHVVCCECIVCRELDHVVNSSSAEVLKYLHASMRVANGKAFSLDCCVKEWMSSPSQTKDWKRTNGQLICPSCIKFKSNFSRKVKKFTLLQSEYDKRMLVPSTPITPLPSSSAIKEFIKSSLQFDLRGTKFGDERRSNILVEFQKNLNVKESMSLLKLREDSRVEVKVGTNERFIVDCCNGDGCQEIICLPSTRR
eukprot:scaffold231669_cov19-Cyclotella_meneghiniana.AAC.1